MRYFYWGLLPDPDWAVIDVDCVRTIRENPDISADTGNSGKRVRELEKKVEQMEHETEK